MFKPHSNKLTIAIDGPSAAGKSTVAKLLAKKSGYTYVDTGVMYRAIAWAALNRDIVPEREEVVERLVEEAQISFCPSGQQFKVLAGDKEITQQLRTPRVSRYASKYSALPAVRSYLVKLQRKLGQEGGVVMEGRDIGTVVFPEADYKFFLQASEEERGRRRFNELKRNGDGADLESTIEQLRHRDKQDSERKLAPLRRAPDAVVIDSTRLTAEQVAEKIYNIVIAGR
jgi:cytidylate kinase